MVKSVTKTDHVTCFILSSHDKYVPSITPFRREVTLNGCCDLCDFNVGFTDLSEIKADYRVDIDDVILSETAGCLPVGAI